MSYQRKQISRALFRVGAAVSVLAYEIEEDQFEPTRALDAIEKITKRLQDLAAEVKGMDS